MDRCLLVRCAAQAALASLLMTRRASVQIRSTIEANPFERCGVKCSANPIVVRTLREEYGPNFADAVGGAFRSWIWPRSFETA